MGPGDGEGSGTGSDGRGGREGTGSRGGSSSEFTHSRFLRSTDPSWDSFGILCTRSWSWRWSCRSSVSCSSSTSVYSCSSPRCSSRLPVPRTGPDSVSPGDAPPVTATLTGRLSVGGRRPYSRSSVDFVTVSSVETTRVVGSTFRCRVWRWHKEKVGIW